MTRSKRLIASMSALACVTLGMGACGAGNAQRRVVARVGHIAILDETLSRWESILKRRQSTSKDGPCLAGAGDGGRVVPVLGSCRLGTAKTRALEYLIETEWLRGEASALGSPVSEEKVDALLRKHEDTKSAAAMKLEVARRLAAGTIVRHVEASVPEVTVSEIALYYEQHKAMFRAAELRLFYIEEDLTSSDSAVKRRREVGLKKTTLAKVSSGTLYETLARPSNMRSAGPIASKIFSAKPREVVGPVAIDHVYYLMQVMHVVPSRVESLAEVRQRIRAQLAEVHRRRVFARFVEGWRRRWVTRTDCRTGYVVEGCRQYRGS
jgi:hypothetical protein